MVLLWWKCATISFCKSPKVKSVKLPGDDYRLIEWVWPDIDEVPALCFQALPQMS